MKARSDRTRSKAADTRGFTLIELTIALAIVALLAAASVMTVSSVTDANLRSAGVALSGAIKQSYDRAAMLQRSQRIVLDLDKQVWWIEFTESPFAIAKEKLSGEEGESAEAMKERLEAAEKKKGRLSEFDDDGKEEIRAMIEGGNARFFVPDEELDAGKPQVLPGGISFARVWTGHQEKPFVAGMAHLHFFPQGWTEPALIELEDDDGDVFSLEVQPLTGRVRVHDRRLEDPDEEEDDGRKDGDL
jgi:general secretion pathway protein H